MRQGIIVTEQRHVYITEGISREAFTDTGVKLTTGDSELTYFIHQHKYDPYGEVPCNDECTCVRTGKVEPALPITQMDDANR